LNSGQTILGQRLGNYLIQEPLGTGGMARVYKGLDTALKRTVAVKVIGDGLRASSSYAQRFEREAQAVANLRHPNIVSIYYFGNQDDLYYLVMEYIDGTDLDALLRNYGASSELMPYSDTMRILEAIAASLDYAHGQGVIHRDVKPSNIMLERSGRPVLTDFGLALRVSEGSIGDTFGTPHYISPEQARSSASAVPQSDLYSLGVVAYEMLTGTVPFDDPAPMALAMQHIMAAVPSPRQFNPQLSPEVETILFKALSKTPEERYGTGAAFCAALRRGLEDTLRTDGLASASMPSPSADPALPPRRLSMQPAVDKVAQELALQQEKGRAPIHSVEAGQTTTWARVKTSSWVPYIVATAVVASLLVVFGIILIGGSGNSPENAGDPTQGAMLPAAELSDEPSPRASETPPLPPTATPEPASPAPVEPVERSIVPSSSPELPSPTAIPPSDTPIPLTPVPPTPVPPTPIPPTPVPPTPEPPTLLPVASTLDSTAAPPAATNVPPDWLPVNFIYDNNGFWWLNAASRSINAQPIRFERIGGGQSFSGDRWAYWTLEPGRCMEIRFSDVGNPQRPNGCRPNAFFTPTRTQGIDFWTGSGQFRVLWNRTEIAVCDIAAGQCSASVPPA
jgi:serine/threonine-protein kinase